MSCPQLGGSPATYGHPTKENWNVSKHRLNVIINYQLILFILSISTSEIAPNIMCKWTNPFQMDHSKTKAKFFNLLEEITILIKYVTIKNAIFHRNDKILTTTTKKKERKTEIDLQIKVV